MGGSSSKTTLFGKKKKKSPLNKALQRLKMALPKRKSSKRKKSLLQKLNLNKQKENSQKKKSQTKGKKKEPQPLKGFFLGNLRKDSGRNAPEGRKEKDREGLGGLGDKMKKKLSPQNKIGLCPTPEVVTEKENKTSLQKLKEKIRSSRLTETKAS